MGAGAIAGIVIAILIILALAVVLAILLLRRRNKNSDSLGSEGEMTEETFESGGETTTTVEDEWTPKVTEDNPVFTNTGDDEFENVFEEDWT